MPKIILNAGNAHNSTLSEAERRDRGREMETGDGDGSVEYYIWLFETLSWFAVDSASWLATYLALYLVKQTVEHCSLLVQKEAVTTREKNKHRDPKVAIQL